MNAIGIGRCAVAFSTIALLTNCGGGAGASAGSTPPIAASPDVLPGQHTFRYTGREQSFKVPLGVQLITVVARGAAGGGYSGSSYGSYYEYFGRGGRVYAHIPTTPGERLYVFVGGQGSTTGGFNGGGNPGSDPSRGIAYGGGGASDVRAGGDTLSHRILVAAGGGGQGNGTYHEYRFVFGGNGGPAVGEAGGTYNYYGNGGGGGGGGTQRQGGDGGAGGSPYGSYGQQGAPGTSGTLGSGGNGGDGGYSPWPSCNDSNYDCEGGGGGGGGSGYYGGGGGGGGASASYSGGMGGGGGGGSSYVEPNATKVRLWRGWINATGDGLVVFSWK